MCSSDLENFCGGLATVFPGTASVESNFSILKWEKDDGKPALTNFLFQGILHGKQHRQMGKLTVGCNKYNADPKLILN